MTPDLLTDRLTLLRSLRPRWYARDSIGTEIVQALGTEGDSYSVLFAMVDEIERLKTRMLAVSSLDEWDRFTDIADFLDQYQDAEIIDGRTHPNKAMQLLHRLRESGL